MRRLTPAWLGVAGLVAAILAVPAPAQADPFPATAIGAYVADNSHHTYCFWPGLFTTDPNVGHNAMSILDNTTDMTVQWAGACSPEFFETDVQWLETDLAAGVAGVWQCNNIVEDSCSRGYAMLDFPAIDQGPNDPQQRLFSAVHEVGHSVGLGHTTSGVNAMRTGVTADGRQGWFRFSAHHVQHINDFY